MKRLLQAPLVLLALLAATFLLLKAVPGDPFGGERAMDPQVRAALVAHYGLDRSLPEQFWRYLAGAVTGDLGPSIAQKGRPVADIIADQLPVSALLGGLALAFAVAIGVLIGTVGAMGRRTPVDSATLVLAVLCLSIPPFVVGPVLALVVGIHWGWLPVAGWDEADPTTMILPALTLGLPFVGRIARLTRNGLHEVMDADFIRTARAKGAGPWRLAIRHALPLGLVPVVGYLGPAVAYLLTGSLVVEKVFQVPGLGREFVESATNRDIPLILGTVLLYGAVVVVCNLLADMAHARIDPRVRK
ncbi:MAG: hypothetical protein RLZZ127_1630 [Planctomycetota bacterium]|jgi:oligopeptide transport system permease protein